MDPEPTITTQTKLPIEKQFSERLKIFFMCAKSLPMNQTQVEKFIGVVAYRSEDAFAKAKSDYEHPGIIIISHGDFAYIEDLFKMINTAEIKRAETPPEPTIEEKKLMAKEVFKSAIIMAAQEYVHNDKDKIKLKGIIKKI